MELSVLAGLTALAEQQFGQVTWRQAAGIGAPTEALIEAGVAEPVTDEVFRIRAGGRARFPETYALWLALAPATPAWERSPPADGVMSRTSAMRLYQIAVASGLAEVTFTDPAAPRGETTIGGRAVLRHHDTVPDDDWTWLTGLPVTTPARTMLDVSLSEDVDELARMAVALVSRHWITGTELRAALERGIARRPELSLTGSWVNAVLAELPPS